MTYYIYILSNKYRGVLYIGSSSDLLLRVWQYKQQVIRSFSSRYNLQRLVYFEEHHNAYAMVQRERQMKKWKRAWKITLIEEKNPRWVDLYEELI